MAERINWTKDMVSQLGKENDYTLAMRWGISTKSVRMKRLSYGIPAKNFNFAKIRWTDEMIADLGTDLDKNIAKKWYLSISAVRQKRVKLGVPPFGRKHRKKYENSSNSV